MKGAILCGIPGSGKTTVFQILKRRFAESQHQDIFTCSHAFTERVFEHLREGLATAAKKQIDSWLDILEKQESLFNYSVLNTHSSRNRFEPLFLAESFHLNQMVTFGFEDEAWRLEVEGRLCNLNIIIVHLWVPKCRILDRTVLRTKRVRSPNWAAYLKTIGPDEAAQAAHYGMQQHRIHEWVRMSACPNLSVDTSNEAWNEIADLIIGAIRLDPSTSQNW